MTRKFTLIPFLFVVLLAPLPFGSNRPWSWSLLSLLIGVLLLIEVLFSGRANKSGYRFIYRLIPGIFLSGLLVAWILFQTLSEIQPDMAHPLWAEASRAISVNLKPTISLDYEATMSSLMRLLTYCGVFWIGAQLGRDPENAEFMLKSFVVASCLYAIYGLLVLFADLNAILWYEKWAYRNDLTSTFVNRNTYATFAGLGLIASVALMSRLLGSGLSDNHTTRAMLLDLADRAFGQAWLPLLGIFVTSFALLLTHSRGGLLSTGVGLFVLFLALSYANVISRKFGGFFIFAIVMFSVFAFVLAGDAVDVRLARTSVDSAVRSELFATIIETLPSNPYLGTGYGTFEQAFMAYKSYALSSHGWDKAHNSYLELAFEIGIPATITVAVIFLWLTGVFISGLVRRRRMRVFAAVGLAATALVAAHAVVDFSLQIPGFTVCYVLLISVAWAQSWPTSRSRG